MIRMCDKRRCTVTSGGYITVRGLVIVAHRGLFEFTCSAGTGWCPGCSWSKVRGRQGLMRISTAMANDCGGHLW